MKMDPKSSFMRSDSASVQSTDSTGKIVKNRFTFLAQIIVVYITDHCSLHHYYYIVSSNQSEKSG